MLMPDDLIPLGRRQPRSEKVHGRRRRKAFLSRRAKRVLVEVAVLVGVLACVAGAAVAFVANTVANNVERLGDPFAALPSRPPEATVGPDQHEPLNILVMGLDTESAREPAQWAKGAQHTDAIMIVHVPAERRSLTVMSIPRDSRVDIPGYGEGEISMAFARGGPGLLVHTVENLTGVRIDHMAISDFESFARITDVLGGVTIEIPETTYDSRRRMTIAAGTYTMGGQEALGYVRQRQGLPGGDLDRVQRQQNLIRSLARQTLQEGKLENPVELTRVLLAVSESITVDDAFTLTKMRQLAQSLASAGGARDIAFFTAPVLGQQTGDDGQPIDLDADRLAAVSAAIASDEIGTFLAENPDYLETLGERVD